MGTDRAADMRVERAAVLAVERSILEHTDWLTAAPVGDVGIDLIAYRTLPFDAVPIQIKGATNGLRVLPQYAKQRMVVAYVLAPLAAAPAVRLLTGVEAWGLPVEYQRRGGRASDYRPDGHSYNWAARTKLLLTILDEYEASTERWASVVEQCRIGSGYPA